MSTRKPWAMSGWIARSPVSNTPAFASKKISLRFALKVIDDQKARILELERRYNKYFTILQAAVIQADGKLTIGREYFTMTDLTVPMVSGPDPDSGNLVLTLILDKPKDEDDTHAAHDAASDANDHRSGDAEPVRVGDQSDPE